VIGGGDNHITCRKSIRQRRLSTHGERAKGGGAKKKKEGGEAEEFLVSGIVEVTVANSWSRWGVGGIRKGMKREDCHGQRNSVGERGQGKGGDKPVRGRADRGLRRRGESLDKTIEHTIDALSGYGSTEPEEDGSAWQAVILELPKKRGLGGKEKEKRAPGGVLKTAVSRRGTAPGRSSRIVYPNLRLSGKEGFESTENEGSQGRHGREPSQALEKTLRKGGAEEKAAGDALQHVFTGPKTACSEARRKNIYKNHVKK